MLRLLQEGEDARHLHGQTRLPEGDVASSMEAPSVGREQDATCFMSIYGIVIACERYALKVTHKPKHNMIDANDMQSNDKVQIKRA